MKKVFNKRLHRRYTGVNYSDCCLLFVDCKVNLSIYLQSCEMTMKKCHLKSTLGPELMAMLNIQHSRLTNVRSTVGHRPGTLMICQSIGANDDWHLKFALADWSEMDRVTSLVLHYTGGLKRHLGLVHHRR